MTKGQINWIGLNLVMLILFFGGFPVFALFLAMLFGNLWRLLARAQRKGSMVLGALIPKPELHNLRRSTMGDPDNQSSMMDETYANLVLDDMEKGQAS